MILFVLCQVSMCTSQREAALCFIPLINTKAFNILSALPKALRDVTVFNTRCLQNSLHFLASSLPLPFLSFGFVCNSDVCAGLCSVTYLTRVHSLESSSTRRTDRGFDSTLCASINKLTILSQSEGKIQLFTNCNA